tara:strand:+ start:1661 stop:1834 length:174 start_codon:yes stop_codon:yes gene_type:complete
MEYVSLTLSEYEEFKRKYEDAVKKKETIFICFGQTVLVAFAKYLIQYYDDKINLKKL